MGLKSSVKEEILSFCENRRYCCNQTAKRFNKEHLSPDLTKDEKREIDRYWNQYHIRFKDYEWHKMFYAVTGIHDPRFIPHPIAARILYRYYNLQRFAPAYADKNMFSNILPQMRFPEMIGKRMNSLYYDEENTCYGESITDQYVDTVFSSFVGKSKGKTHEIIIKEAIGSYQGKGVKKVCIHSKNELLKILSENRSKDFIIQMAVRQHPFFAQFNEDSVNIIRITTWRTGNTVYCFAPCVRFGIKGSSTDVAFVNGTEIVQAAKIDRDGKTAGEYITLGGKYIPLPDNLDNTVPQWETILECVKSGALSLPHFGIVGWDITVDADDQVICLEYNIKQPGTVVYQFAHGPLAREATDDLLSFLREEKNSVWIPRCARIR